MCTQQIKTFNPLNNEAKNYCKPNQSHRTFWLFLCKHKSRYENKKKEETSLQTSEFLNLINKKMHQTPGFNIFCLDFIKDLPLSQVFFVECRNVDDTIGTPLTVETKDGLLKFWLK